jgi:hypothetical protein
MGTSRSGDGNHDAGLEAAANDHALLSDAE